MNSKHYEKNIFFDFINIGSSSLPACSATDDQGQSDRRANRRASGGR
jgi:hypothetical protein